MLFRLPRASQIVVFISLRLPASQASGPAQGDWRAGQRFATPRQAPQEIS